MLDFDNIDDWAPRLTAEMRPFVPNSVEQTLVESELEYIEDAQDILFDLTDRDAVIDAVVAWLRSRNISGYHGSRLTDEETDSVLTVGLIPLGLVVIGSEWLCRLTRGGQKWKPSSRLPFGLMAKATELATGKDKFISHFQDLV